MDTTDIEKKSLEAHVELCAERYNALDNRIESMIVCIDEIKSDIKQMHIIKQKFYTNIMVLHILNNLSWTTISKQLISFKFVIGLKDECKHLILTDGKLNKYHTLFTMHFCKFCFSFYFYNCI
jgi:hypothetical protein